MSHLLAIGATGMLGGALRVIAPGFEEVTVVARRASAFDLDPAFFVDVDWTHTDAFVAMVSGALSMQGPVTKCLLWVHDAGAEALARTLASLEAPCEVVHVLGSASGDPRAEIERWRGACRAGVLHTSVTLGRVPGGSSYRWLTHAEICDGVLRAWRTGRDVVVGEVV